MFEIDKNRFGKFLAEQRKEKGYTQKELAQKLMVSDKAVSKWETGTSMPDVSLLIPLAELLDVTVTELLEGKKIQTETTLATGQVEELVKKVLTLSDETPEKKRQFRRKNILIYLGAVIVTCLIMLVIHQLGITIRELSPASYTYEILSIIFGAYFWIFIREKLPAYFDENKISAYSDGFFHMNLPGIHFNNNNWPHIVRAGRLWTICSMILCPVIQPCGFMILKKVWSTSVYIHMVLLFLYLGTLFIPMIVVGKMYE